MIVVLMFKVNKFIYIIVIYNYNLSENVKKCPMYTMELVSNIKLIKINKCKYINRDKLGKE